MSLPTYRFSCYLLFLLLIHTVTAQTYKGIIVDMENGKALEAVAVTAIKENKNILAYSYSEKDGSFTLTVPAQSAPVSLSFYIMGYESYSIPVSTFAEGQTVRLKAKSFQLKEVKVTAERIRQHQDTLIYSVSGFKQKQDRSIADVISKMPGLEVGANGGIKFQGKSINKFYIEGMDLLGGKYAQASENLPADKVLSVQVLQNHQPVSALRNIQFSEQAALNIILKDEAKGSWNETLDIGGGSSLQGSPSFLYDNRLTAMMFNSRLQSISMYKNNNTGKDIQHELKELSDFTSTDDDKGWLTSPVLNSPGLKEARHLFNESHLFATNWLCKTRKDQNLRLQLSAFYSEDSKEQYTDTKYLNIEDTPTYTEEASAWNKNYEWKGEALYEVNKPQFYLSSRTEGYANFDKSTGNVTLNGINALQRVIPRERHVTEDLQMIRNLNNHRSFSIYSLTTYHYLPGKLLLLDGNTEHLGIGLLDSHSYTYFQHRLGWFYINYKTGIKMKQQKMDVSYSNIDTRRKYKESRVYLEPSLRLNRGKLKMEASATLGYMHHSLDGNTQSKMQAEPQLYVNYDISGTTSIGANYSYQETPLELENMHDIPVFIGYRTVISHNGELKNIQRHTLNASFKYSQPIRGYFFHLNGFYSRTKGNPLYESMIKENIYYQQESNLSAHSDNYGINGRFSLSPAWSKAVISLTGRYLWNDYSLIINQHPVPSQIQNGEIGLSYSLRPLPALSIEGKSSYLYALYINKEAKDTSHKGLKSYQHTLKLFLLPTEKWQIGLENEVYHSNDESVSFNFFSDLSIAYKAKAWEIRLLCNNLWGRNDYQRKLISTTQETFTMFRLRPREGMIKFLMEF